MADYGGVGGGASLRDALNTAYPLTNLGGISTGFPPAAGPESVPLPQPNQRRINNMESGLVNQYASQIGKPSHQWSPQDVVNFQSWRQSQGAGAGTPPPRVGMTAMPVPPQGGPVIPPIPPVPAPTGAVPPIPGAPPNPQDDSAQAQLLAAQMQRQPGMMGPPNYAAQLGLTRPY